MSSNEANFLAEIQPYQKALSDSGYLHQLKYTQNERINPNKRKRTRQFTWFNPPYNKAEATNVGNKFLAIASSTFTPSHALRKIFNRNTMKISYSCMPNIAAKVSSHNHHILRTAQTPSEGQTHQQRTCNCRDKANCPLNGHCLQKSVIYQATVTSDSGTTETYVGLTEQEFKSRYRNHTTSFNNKKYKNSTELSKHIWELRDDNTRYDVKWTIISRAPAYSTAYATCQLCLTEKYYIMCKPDMCTLNKRNKLASSCSHMNKFLLANYKSKLKD
jgi:hypothetical protein